MKDFTITPEMSGALKDSILREIAFWNRHSIPWEHDTRSSGEATRAHRAWARCVEEEFKVMEHVGGRVLLDCPLGRKAFILGWNRGHGTGVSDMSRDEHDFIGGSNGDRTR